MITSSLISAIILTRSAQELFPDIDKSRMLKISKLILHQIGKYSKAKNRSESDEFPELHDLMSTGRKLLRRIVAIYCSGLIVSRTESLQALDNILEIAMIVHDLFAQDDAAMEDSLYVKSIIGLCTMLQKSCGDQYDLCLESLAARVGEFERAIVNNQGSFPDGKLIGSEKTLWPKYWIGILISIPLHVRAPSCGDRHLMKQVMAILISVADVLWPYIMK